VSTQTPEHDETLIVGPASQPEVPRKRPRYGLRAAIAVGSLLLIVSALYAISYVMAGDKLPTKAVVSGVPVGGLTPQAAVAKLSEKLGPEAAEPIKVTASGRSAQIKPIEAGLRIDYEQSIAAAGGGRSFDPRQIFTVLTGGSSTEAVIVVDQAKLTKATADLAAKWDSKAADARLSFSGATIRKKPARTGFTLNRDGAATAIRGAFLVATTPVALPAQIQQPKITTNEVDKVVEDFAKPAVSAPVKVKAGSSGTFSVSPTMIGNSISFKAEKAKRDRDYSAH
jgi:hypothetical protein